MTQTRTNRTKRRRVRRNSRRDSRRTRLVDANSDSDLDVYESVTPSPPRRSRRIQAIQSSATDAAASSTDQPTAAPSVGDTQIIVDDNGSDTDDQHPIEYVLSDQAHVVHQQKKLSCNNMVVYAKNCDIFCNNSVIYGQQNSEEGYNNSEDGHNLVIGNNNVVRADNCVVIGFHNVVVGSASLRLSTNRPIGRDYVPNDETLGLIMHRIRGPLPGHRELNNFVENLFRRGGNGNGSPAPPTRPQTPPRFPGLAPRDAARIREGLQRQYASGGFPRQSARGTTTSDAFMTEIGLPPPAYIDLSPDQIVQLQQSPAAQYIDVFSSSVRQSRQQQQQPHPPQTPPAQPTSTPTAPTRRFTTAARRYPIAPPPSAPASVRRQLEFNRANNIGSVDWPRVINTAMGSVDPSSAARVIREILTGDHNSDVAAGDEEESNESVYTLDQAEDFIDSVFNEMPRTIPRLQNEPDNHPQPGDDPQKSNWKCSVLDLKGDPTPTEYEPNQCILCLENERDTLFECGHLHCCRQCARKLYKPDTNQTNCPTCKAVVTRCMIVFRN